MSKKTSLLRRRANRIPGAERRFYHTMDDIAARILHLLDERGMTQSDLAEATGKGKSYISRVLGGGVNLTLKTIADFETALGADLHMIPGAPPAPRRRRRFTAEVGFVPTASDKPRQIAGVGVDDTGSLCFLGKPTYHINTSGKQNAPTAEQRGARTAHELADAA